MGRVPPEADGLDPQALPHTKPEADTQSKSWSLEQITLGPVLTIPRRVTLGPVRLLWKGEAGAAATSDHRGVLL